LSPFSSYTLEIVYPCASPAMLLYIRAEIMLKIWGKPEDGTLLL
jgi:hypothetical protein